MAHSDDDGLVLPPRLAPTHVVVLPIYRSDDEKRKVMEYCDQVVAGLKTKQYDGKSLEVEVDDRDVRGGDKKWHHVKRGVPLRVEIGPRDVDSQTVFVGRRDLQKSNGQPWKEFVETVDQQLADMQQALYDKAFKFREDHTVKIDSLDDFRDYFTAKDSQSPEIHGGFAWCHWSESEEMEAILKELKVTPRCIPLSDNTESGTCLFTGKLSQSRAVFAKAY